MIVEESGIRPEMVEELSYKGIAEKRANGDECVTCVDKSASDLTTDTDSKLLASMEILITSSSEKEIAKEGVQCDMVKCVILGFKEGNEPASVDLNLLESGLKDGFKSSDTCQLNVSVFGSPHKVAIESENRSEIEEQERMVGFGDDIKIVSGDENMKPSSMVLNDSMDDSETSNDDDNTAKEKMKAEKAMMAILQEECKKEATDGSNAIDKTDEGAIGTKKCKRGRKKKVIESSECIRDTIPKEVKVDKEGVKVTGRLLRSRTMAMSGGAKVDESRLNESLVGFKRQMEAECFDQTEFLKEVNESSQLAGRPQKKQKRLGRPPKMQGESGFSKTKDECFDQIEIQKEINERSQSAGRPQKKQKRRGRPPKIQGETGFRKMKDECFDQIEIQKEVNARSQLAVTPQNKQKRRGRPPKMQSETGLKKKMKDDCFDQVDLHKEVNESSQLTGSQQKKTQTKNRKDTVIKNLKGHGWPPKAQAVNFSTNTEQPDNNLLKAKDVKEGPEIQHVENQDQGSDITGDNKQKVKISEESNDHTTFEETGKGDNTIQLKNISRGEDKRKKQQIRDQIVSMIMKAGWTIEYRPRQGREYLDAVYVDQKGRTHWSITKAYFSLKKKIEKGDADTKEISAFTPIPVEEMNVLFRIVSKIRSDKNKKKNKKGTDMSKAEIVISGEAPSKKTSNKKGKHGKKKKEIHNSAVKLAKKLSNVKVKKDKYRHENGVMVESAAHRRPKVSKKGGQSRKPCLVARNSGKGLDQDNGDCAMYNGKRNIFSWMIDSGVVMPGGKLMYGEGRRRNRFLEGQVTGDGIHCSCCNEILDISNFVSHSGGELDQPLKNIYYQSGASLLTCLLESWKKEVGFTNIRFNYVDVKGDDPNDDTCNICGDGGDLICCDGCPSTFHQSCLDIQNFPSGDWHCIYCCCKFCGLVACGASHHAPNSEMITCCLFHHSCLQEENVVHVGSSSLSFCGRKCQETYIGVKFELKEGYSWTLLKCYDLSHHLDDLMKIECNSKLAVAFSVMDECFVPIMDERSGINRIHNVVYNCGSNFRRLDYSGFFTAILEKGGELISAASIRIHGNQLAEMPFIGTRNMYRRQGMCRRLLDAIEDALFSVGVDELVIPAIPELFKTWTKVFGFKPLEEPLRQAMKGMSLIVFPGTDMLHKQLLKNQFANKTLIPVAGDKAVECITVENDDNTLFNEQTLTTHLESETPPTSFQKSEIQLLPSDNEHKSVGLVNNDVTGVKMSLLASETVPKNSFDLNLQPAATDIDIQSIDDESVSRDPQVCKNPFEISDSMAQVDNTATQPLVLVDCCKKEQGKIQHYFQIVFSTVVVAAAISPPRQWWCMWPMRVAVGWEAAVRRSGSKGFFCYFSGERKRPSAVCRSCPSEVSA
ncbi:hypothetical protein L1987_59552 [Smallanthus sonchifolius]|uniref:Uncharacterized protein n=1 Tax=Smallanthus sonchifolius TaxID=185202 RepID=A0ACB9D5L2_9ASTR|nr:hypothetical protein L1987_59552 [Smallanthus sonchifolius]